MRRFCLTLGLVLLALIWFGPLLSTWRGSFAAHMLAHMGVVAIASPLIAIGWRDSGVSLRFISLPILASLIELVVVWGWHAPALRLWVERSTFATVLEQASFLGAGLFLWHASLMPSSRDDRAHQAAGAFALLLTSVHMTLLGALLALSPRPLYGVAAVTCFGMKLDAAQDQQLGAVIMLFVGAVVYLAGGVALLGRILQNVTGARKAVG
ncbi:Cytochrome c oxidase assembly factor CtaG [Mesorhizobium albiziae]|uniref:Cytochrome c oxidase assembly factor CtaG n=1 Tax=Neomesorhizobium albiziae TaxID=335020 RepID=A0A1I4CQI6_9HYPH|nr:cytochrome c oxidase assembly protein [Mesorhizobium albiziae]GLS30975.1 hypothetical protein GCM10007937_26840 [Mesorhizobium albiziae]SFK83564.1 Cytochrome c oxidase assembly factor CtaG [Mesorhizobium albiziae]